jgi:starch synthase
VTSPRAKRTTGGSVAIVPWGDVIEDFLDPLGLSIEQFAGEMSGGWLFGYVDALRRAGVDAVVVCVSRSVRRPCRIEHEPTGAPLHLLPASGAYRALRPLVRDPYAYTTPDAVAAPGVRAHVARHASPYLATPVGALARVLRHECCRALVVQEYEYARFDVCATLGAAVGLPVFATFQGGTLQLTALEPFVRPLTVRLSAGLIVPSSREERRVRARYRMPADRIARIFNPLDVQVWQPAAASDRSATRRSVGIEPDALVVAWHGRVDLYRKGLDVLLHAWADLASNWTGRPLRLLLVGSGPDSAALDDAVRSRGLDGVRRIDEYVLDRGRVAALLRAADVYAFPSRHEGFPVAPVEAMACGLPVVGADAPGVRDILAGGEHAGGVVVPAVDAPAMSAALRRLLHDASLRARLATNAEARARTAFSLEAVGRQLRRFLVERRPVHGPAHPLEQPARQPGAVTAHGR